jgi:predicted NACHT family NTPase
LRQGQFLLLLDGVNELPSPEAQRNLQKFRQDYQQTTPMVFTTRDLGVGGDLGISKKLEMQPLTETQMGEFVRGYLPETGEQMLQQLGGRLREFGETPLLLMMLCSVFASNGIKYHQTWVRYFVGLQKFMTVNSSRIFPLPMSHDVGGSGYCSI